MTKEKFEIDLTSFKKFKGPKELYEITGVDCSYNDQSKKGLLLKLKVYKSQCLDYGDLFFFVL